VADDRARGARIRNYVLGGRNNYPADRDAAENSLTAWPALRRHLEAERDFAHRVGRHLVAGCGVRQFLEIGTGDPTPPYLHEIVEAVDPAVRVRYRTPVRGTPAGRTVYADADVRSPRSDPSGPGPRPLDWDRPIGLMMIGLVQSVEDDAVARHEVAHLVDAMPSGSYVAMSIATDEFDPVPLAEVRRQYRAHGETLAFRDRTRAARFFDGVDLVEPGLVPVHRWRPDDGLDAGVVVDAEIAAYGGVARKP
jgi:hypothetical protein